MSTTRLIYQYAVFLLASASIVSFLIFGASLQMRLSAGQPGYLPLEWLHALTSGAWLLLLPAQAWLIRAGRFGAHRAMGKTSYVLAPVLVVSIIWIAHDVLAFDGITDGAKFILAVRAFLVIYFTGFYLMAIRAAPSRPDVHARWMICSAMVLTDPALSRLSAFLHPVPFATGFHQYVTFTVMDAVILSLAVLDLKERRYDVFAPALLLLLAGQSLALAIWDEPLWQAFAEAFRGVPLPLMFDQ